MYWFRFWTYALAPIAKTFGTDEQTTETKKISQKKNQHIFSKKIEQRRIYRLNRSTATADFPIYTNVFKTNRLCLYNGAFRLSSASCTRFVAEHFSRVCTATAVVCTVHGKYTNRAHVSTSEFLQKNVFHEQRNRSGVTDLKRRQERKFYGGPISALDKNEHI